ncbi:MAG: hypothetical protein R3257_06270 [bacterium]|nr:hypothetical protein [bacterium]
MADEEALTAGYPRIEKLVETEKFDEVNASFGKAYDELQQIAKAKSGLGKGKAAKKALKAYELTMDLFKELLRLKYQMIEAAEKEEGK